MVDTCGWAEQLVREVNSATAGLDRRDARELQVERFVKLVRRVASYPDCPDCQALKPRINLLADRLQYAPAMTKAEKRDYLGQLGSVMTHLQKMHGLVGEGQYLAVWMSLGTAAGMALGATLSNPGVGMALGLAVGLSLGAAMDTRAKKDGRVI
jgi:hypothetical protein